MAPVHAWNRRAAPEVQALIREAVEKERERCARLAKWWVEAGWNGQNQAAEASREAGDKAATAIRAGQQGGE